jgi:hypothetical protein
VLSEQRVELVAMPDPDFSQAASARCARLAVVVRGVVLAIQRPLEIVADLVDSASGVGGGEPDIGDDEQKVLRK